MIISHEHRYIFLHSRKTAGSSICVSLARSLGPNDLQLSGLSETFQEGIPFTTRVREEAEAWRMDRQSLPQKLLRFLPLSNEKKARNVKKYLLEKYRHELGESQPQHSYATSIQSNFPNEFKNYRKFCVVRNPWTKAVSDYFWRIKNIQSPPSFEEFIRAIEKGDSLNDIVRLRYHDNWPIYTIDDEIVADRVIRFEKLKAGVQETCTEFGIPFDGWLPNAKGGHRPKSGKKALPASFYTQELKDTVGRLYENEINAFGYTFDELSTNA